MKDEKLMAAEVLQPILEEAWLSEVIPEEWTDVKIPKQGNLKICDNCRICVMPAISKVICKVILDQIKDHLYSTIDREQAGFRPRSSCVDHINALRRLIIEQSAEYRSDLQLVVVDFEKSL